MKYINPIILADYSDPDVIRVGSKFYMVASSFNHVPGVPVLRSENLVEWEIINHVLPKIPFKRFDGVCHGDGAWAPSIRFNGGKFYCLIPFPDEGIFVSEADDPCGNWSPLRPLFLGKGYEDPCPIWADGKCYVVMAFAKSRIGFNSVLAVFETDEGLTNVSESYKIIFDGHDVAPNIEGPKFMKRGEYFYVLCPAGGVGTGWQVALRSKNIYGPYESKIIMLQGGTDVNGPHQGALIDLDDGGERWAFLHFQDMAAYGRVIHLQPAKWINGWPLCGALRDDNLPGYPVKEGEYPVDKITGAHIDQSDEFCGDKLSPVWQTPANPKEEWRELKGGLRLNCAYYGGKTLANVPQLHMQKVSYLNFTVETECELRLEEEGDEAGFTVFGRSYYYLRAVRSGGRNLLEIRGGAIGGEDDETLASVPCGDGVRFKLVARYEERHRLSFKFYLGESEYTQKFYAAAGVWTGAKIGIYALSRALSGGYAKFKYFRVKNDG